MRLLKAILSTLAVFGGVILLTWIGTLGTIGLFVMFAIIFVAVIFAFY